MIKLIHTIGCCFVAALLLISSPAQSLECATRKCYIDVYNSVDTSELGVMPRVREIHRKLSNTIGSIKAKRSKLLVIDSTGYPWAVALTDNTVVITKGAIVGMYREGDMELGDARLAFVLGHELSHLETEDLFHHRAFVLKHDNREAQPSWLQGRPEEELRADLRGYTFATLAGYKTELLIGGDTDFFRTWLSQIGRTDSSTHPDLETRRQYLESGFNRILQSVPYYQYSIALAHFGHYKDAQNLLEDHLNLVETKEAYTNLGYVHLQRARAIMPVDMAYQYWIPTLLEPASELKISRSLFRQELPEQALQHLDEAEELLKHAIDMDDTSLTSYINLAAVYLYMPNKLHRAYAAIEDARSTPLGRIKAVRDQLESIYQLIRVRDDLDSGDRWPKARDTLIKIADEPQSAPANLLFNLARMLDNRGRESTAKHYWQVLHDRLKELPPAYQSHVCFRLEEECTADAVDSPWLNESLPLGRDIRYPDIKKYLAKYWNVDHIPAKQLPGLYAEVFTNDKGDSLLALDHHIEMMILRNIPDKYRNINSLQDKFGVPKVALPLADGQILSFNTAWSAYVENEQVKEIWVKKL